VLLGSAAVLVSGRPVANAQYELFDFGVTVQFAYVDAIDEFLPVVTTYL